MERTLSPTIAKAVAEGPSLPFRVRAAYMHSTWAKTFSCRPELYIQPETVAEVAHVVNLARRCRRQVTTVGCGHSPNSITCTSSWLVNLDKLSRVLSTDVQSGVVVVEAGIRLHQLSAELEDLGLALPNQGSINEQSLAGAISTGSHGSSLQRGLLSESVLGLKMTLADGKTRSCSADENSELFRAALLSLGGLGIITEVTLQVVPAYSLHWQQVIDSDSKMLSRWTSDLWSHAEFVRVWWFPYTHRAVVWSASKAKDNNNNNKARYESAPPLSFLEGFVGYYTYLYLLLIAQLVPRILPWVEWFVFGLQYGFTNGAKSEAIQKGSDALLTNCLYPQFANEWAIPLDRGTEALSRLSSWLNRLKPGDPGYVPHNIPFSSEGLYVHSPVEVRVSDTSNHSLRSVKTNTRPYLDPTLKDRPTLFLNHTLYRPYNQDPPCRERYYEAFEWLMRDLGGRPHWAKNFKASGQDIERMYGDDLLQWRKIRDEVDAEGMFVGTWHREHVMAGGGNLFEG